MKYMIMMFGKTAELWETQTPEWISGMNELIMRLDQEIKDKGEHVDGQKLAGTNAAKTVVIEDGAPVATDGPFAEAKESVVGYWIVDVDSEDRAVEIVSEIVAYTKVPMEIRQVMDEPPDA